MAFSLFSKPTNKSKDGASTKSPALDVRSANDSKRPEPESVKESTAPSRPKNTGNNSTVLLGVGKDWRPAYSKIEVAESRTTLCSPLENAALLYASGQSEAARQTLSDAIVNDPEAHASLLAWLALFDVLQRSGDKSAADDLALKFVVAFERSPPIWDDKRNVPGVAVPDAKAKGTVLVRFSGELAMDSPGLQSFAKVAKTSPKCRIDVAGINAVEQDACRYLADLLRTLRRNAYPLQLQDAERLRDLLQSQVHVGEPVGEGYWMLLLELLQWMKDSAVFEEHAVNYAISFEVSPPSWEGHSPHNAPQSAAAIKDTLDVSPDPEDAYALHGVLTGPSESQVLRVREFAKDKQAITVDCSGVERIDFVCAGSLLNELEGVERLEKPIQIVGASPIVQALLLVIGIKARYFFPRLQ